MESACSRPATRASRFPAPVDVAVETIRATFGLGSLTRLSAIGRPSASARMSQATLFSDSPKSEEISKREATAFRRAYSRRLKLALRTSGSGCSFLPWQTAKAASGGYEKQKDGSLTETLCGEAQTWSKERIQAAEQGAWALATGEISLPERPDQRQQWCTPGAMGGGSVSRGGERIGEPLLAGQATAMNWPTPDAQMMNMGESPESFEARRAKLKETARNGNGAGTPLAMSVVQWPTPRSEDAESCGNQRLNQLSEDVTIFPTSLPPATTMSDGSERSPIAPGSPQPSGRRKLNPDFVEWLMGLPPLWTLHWPSSGTPVCGPAVMESWWKRRRQRLCSYLRRIAETDP